MAPETGLEPVTRRLTAGCSTIELLWKTSGAQSTHKPLKRQSDCRAGTPPNGRMKPPIARSRPRRATR